MSLLDHAKAALIMAEALEDEYRSTNEAVPGRPLLLRLSLAHHGAAKRMEAAYKAEIEAAYARELKG